MTRRESREQAFALLFEKSFHDAAIEELAADATQARDVIVTGFAMRLAQGVEAHMEQIDEKITAFSHNWNKERISRVALSVLRLATYEMFFEEDIPVSVSINEAVELAKKYGSEDDAPFINGILGGISRDPALTKESV